MNRIVKEHYPVEKLPEDLREQLPEDVKVKITVEVEQASLKSSRLASLKGRRKPNFRTVADVNAYLSTMREAND
jgi:hypothetical protein